MGGGAPEATIVSKALGHGQSADTAAYAIENSNVLVGGCDALADHGSSETAIVIDPTTALGSLACTSDGGQVASFDLTSPDGALPAVRGMACGAPPLRHADGIVAGTTYTFVVGARKAAGDAPSWGTVCRALAVDGLTVSATCDPLAEKGGLRVDVPALFATAKVACADGAPRVRTLSVTSGGQPVDATSAPARCDAGMTLGPLPAGPYEVALVATDASGAEALAATCTGTVEAGLLATASCTAKPAK